MIENFEFSHWFWFVLALVLFVLEMMVPGVIFMWLAFAGIAVGALVFFIPAIGWEMQFIIFSILGIISVYTGRNYLRKNPIVSEDENLNNRGSRYIGHKYKLERELVNGEGKVRIGDSLWLVRGEFDAEVGTTVRVTGVDGVVLIVEPT